MMKKIIRPAILTIFIVMINVMMMSTAVFANSEQRVFDEMDFLSETEVSNLESQIAKCQEEYGIDVVVVMTEDSMGQSIQDRADDFYDYNGFKHDGIILLVDYASSELHISTSGKAIKIFTDERLEKMDYNLRPHLRNSPSFAAETFISDVSHWCLQDDPSILSAGAIALLTIIPLLIAFISCTIVYSKYKLKASTYSYPLSERGSIELTRSEDIFIRENTTSVKVESSSGSGSGSGGSSTHRSSSGNRHGGRSGKF